MVYTAAFPEVVYVLDAFVKNLNSLDTDVHIRVGPRAAGKKQASVTVELVTDRGIRTSD